MSPELQRQGSWAVNEIWISSVWLLTSTRFDCSQEFLVTVGLYLTQHIYAQREKFGQAQTLHVLNCGLIARKGTVLRRGCFWGDDVLLSDLTLCEDPSVVALTHAEIHVLTRPVLFDQLLPKFPRDALELRKCTVKLACFRGI